MATRTKTKAPTKSAIERLRAAFFEAPRERWDKATEREIRALAKRFGVPFREADEAAHFGRWELEREGRRALAWHREHGLGARTEDEFCERIAAQTYSHVAAAGPEGRRLAYAYGRDIWRRAMPPALEWEAAILLEEARADFDAIEEARKGITRKREARRAAGQASDPTSPVVVLGGGES